MVPAQLDVEFDGSQLDIGISHDDHDVRVGCQPIEVSGKVGSSQLEALESRLKFSARHNQANFC